MLHVVHVCCMKLDEQRLFNIKNIVHIMLASLLRSCVCTVEIEIS
jgi:hypothetical protein